AAAGSGHLGWQHRRALARAGADAVAADVDPVVAATGDPVVAVGVAAAAVAAEVHARVGLEVGVDEALVVAVHGAHLAGPGVEHHQVALGLAFEQLALGVHDRRPHAEEGLGRRAGLGGDRAVNWRDHDAVGLG